MSVFATSLATHAWRARQADFIHALKDSWHTNGGSLPFRLIKESPLPPVLDLTICHKVRLLPQRWSPYGLEWIKVANPQDFPVDCQLRSGESICQVVSVASCQDSIQLSARLTRREASELHRAFTTADPQIWAPAFLRNWNSSGALTSWLMLMKPRLIRLFKPCPHSQLLLCHRCVGMTGSLLCARPKSAPCAVWTVGPPRNFASSAGMWSSYCSGCLPKF